MGRRFWCVLLTAVIVLSFPLVVSTASAVSADYPLVTAAGGQGSPVVYGDKVVWVDGRNDPTWITGNTDIYMYDFETNTESQITSNTAEQNNPDFWGDWVVYCDYHNGSSNGDIFATNVVTGEEKAICTNGAAQARPRISGDIIVWEDFRYDGNGDIFYYDMATETEYSLPNIGYERFPDVYGDKIAYYLASMAMVYDISEASTTFMGGMYEYIEMADGSVVYDHYNAGTQVRSLRMYSFATGEQTILSLAHTPDIGERMFSWDGTTLLYSSNEDGNEFSLYGKNITLDEEFTVAAVEGVEELEPAVSGSTYVWRDSRNQDGSDYYDLYTNRYIPGAVPVTTATGIPTGWVNHDVEVSLEVTPTGSTIYYDQYGWGTETYSGPIQFNVFEGVSSLEYWAKNSWGEEERHSAEIKIDKSSPVTDISINHASVPYLGSASITLDPSDPYSGVAATYWRIDYGTWRRGTQIDCSTVGLHTIQFRSVDNVGHIEEIKGRTFTVDPNADPVYTPVEGADRYATSIEISKDAFPDGITGADYQGHRTCVVATGENWPDALGASSLAGALGGPVLLTRTASLPSAVAAEIGRLGADRVIIIGSSAAVSNSVAKALGSVSGVDRIERLAGANRYETATKVASATVDALGAFYDGSAFVSTGLNFPDALGAAPIAAHKGWPVYLVGGTSDSAVARAMDAHGVSKVHILGSRLAVPDSVKTLIKAETGLGDSAFIRLEGKNRYETASAVAQYAVDYCNMRWDGVALATGEAFPDALSGGLMQGRAGSVVLLTHPASLSTPAQLKLTENKSEIDEVRYLGSVDAVSQAVRAKVKSIVE